MQCLSLIHNALFSCLPPLSLSDWMQATYFFSLTRQKNNLTISYTQAAKRKKNLSHLHFNCDLFPFEDFTFPLLFLLLNRSYEEKVYYLLLSVNAIFLEKFTFVYKLPHNKVQIFVLYKSFVSFLQPSGRLYYDHVFLKSWLKKMDNKNTKITNIDFSSSLLVMVVS